MGSTTFVWDPVFDCVTHELDENNAVKAVYHNEPQQYGGVLSQRRGNTSHYHHHDALGSTRFLTDSSGNVTDTYLNDAWGNSVASTGTTVNPFKWVGKYGYYTDNSTGQVYVRARMYLPTVARWTSVDPIFIFTRSPFIYCRNAISIRIDPSGLLDCFCRGRCDFGRSGVQDRLNQFITSELSRAFGELTGGTCPLSEPAAEEFRKSVRNWFGSDDGDDIPTTWIEMRLQEVLAGMTIPGLPYVISSFPPIVIPTADCMPLKCHGRSLCIGIDKIGHFFQQGYMGYELAKAGLSDWITAFFQMTEGLPVSPTPNDQHLIDGRYVHFHEWFNSMRFYFMGFGDQFLSNYFRKWGGRLGGLTQSSSADVAANLAGKEFYDNLPNLCCCLSWYAAGNQGPLSSVTPCFDICDYLTPGWEE